MAPVSRPVELVVLLLGDEIGHRRGRGHHDGGVHASDLHRERIDHLLHGGLPRPLLVEIRQKPVRQQPQLGRGEGQRVEKRLLERLVLGHEQRLLQTRHARTAEAVVGAVAEDREAHQRHVLLVRSVEHLLGQRDVAFVGPENLVRVAAQLAQLDERHHARKEEQADDAQKADRHPFAHTRHISVLKSISCKYTIYIPIIPPRGRQFRPPGRGPHPSPPV